MKKILKDSDGNIFEATVISGVPAGFEDITGIMQKDVSLDSIDNQYLEAIEVPAVDYVAPVAEVLAVPEVLADDGVTVTTPAVDYVAPVDEVLAVDRHFVIQKKATGDVDRRNAILDKLRALRAPLLVEADIEINKLLDINADATAMRTYRQALRDIPGTYIKVNGDPKVATDTIDLKNFIWPVKP